MFPIDASFECVFSELEKLGTEEFRAENLTGESFRSVDVRYQGQGYELNVPFGPEMAAQFHDLHQRRYGFANETRTLEVVNVRVRMVSAAEAFEAEIQPLQEGDGSLALIGTRPVYFDDSFHETRIYDRDLLRSGDTFAGPAIVSEYSSATVLPLGDVLRVDGLGNLVIEVHG
jgi:N-methylhydantoinase A